MFMSGSNYNRAIVYCGWGQIWVDELRHHFQYSLLPDFPKIFIGPPKELDEIGNFVSDAFLVEHVYRTNSLLRKTEFYEQLPDKFNSYVFLDSDTIVLDDISLGFEKAELHDLAITPAPHYTLGAFWGFDKVLKEENLQTTVMQYNTGVIFFKKTIELRYCLTRGKNLLLNILILPMTSPFLRLLWR